MRVRVRVSVRARVRVRVEVRVNAGGARGMTERRVGVTGGGLRVSATARRL